MIQVGETIIWSLTLKVEHGIKVFEERVLKKVHHKEVHNCHSSPDIAMGTMTKITVLNI